jgi:hypothetical protein
MLLVNVGVRRPQVRADNIFIDSDPHVPISTPYMFLLNSAPKSVSRITLGVPYSNAGTAFIENVSAYQVHMLRAASAMWPFWCGDMLPKGKVCDVFSNTKDAYSAAEVELTIKPKFLESVRMDGRPVSISDVPKYCWVKLDIVLTGMCIDKSNCRNLRYEVRSVDARSALDVAVGSVELEMCAM